jgi:transcriptional regulator with XRE-family HTH domain
MASPGQKETIGNRLRQLRRAAGLSQQDLASDQVSAAYISRIEAGTRQPSLKVVRALAAKLNVDPSYLESGDVVSPSSALALRFGLLELRLGVSRPDERFLKDAEKIVAEAVEAGEVALAQRARVILAAAKLVEGAYEEARRLLETTLARGVSPTRYEVLAYRLLASAYVDGGSLEAALRLLRQQIALARDAGRSTGPLYAASLAAELARAGRWDEVEQALELTTDIELAEKPWREWGAERATQVANALSEKRLGEADSLLAEALGVVGFAAAIVDAAQIRRLKGLVAARRGEVSTGRDDLAGAERMLRIWGDDQVVVSVVIDDVRLLLEAGEAAAAEARARDALSLARAGGSPVAVGLASWALGDSLALEGKHEAAVEALREAYGLLSTEKRLSELLGVGRSLSHSLRASGRPEEALEALESASAAVVEEFEAGPAARIR